MRIKFYLLCTVLSLFSRAQNLVPDSSFEDNKFLPMDFSLVSASRTWSLPSLGTSDLFCKCDRKTKYQTDRAHSFVDVPRNAMGYQLPNSGSCYAGFFLFSHGDYREYLQCPLVQPLEKNKTYLFSMYISLADYSRMWIDQVGICFLKNKVDHPSTEVMTDQDPLYINIEREVGTDAENWHEVSVTYTASGGESYLLLGSFEVNKLERTNFDVPKEMKTRINQRTERDAYYYVDDVSLVETGRIEEAASNETLAQEAGPEPEPGTVLVLQHVLFSVNEAVLLPSSFSELDSLAVYLHKHQELRIGIFGHTDNSGNEAANKKLSTDRARAVADYLSTHGIDPGRISYEGYGSSKPVATNDTEEGKQQNRRVEFILTEE